MSIWFTAFSLQQLNDLGKDTLADRIGIEITEIGADFLRGRMPVDARTRQPHGILHGGASVALAETLASVAAHCVVDWKKFRCVGLDINANHIRSAGGGFVTGTAHAFHLGRSTHVWEVRIDDEAGKLVCISRVTMAIIALS